ncbi:MAG: NUDIX domain-containing protein [Actinomycetota bacterium]|nr:NUDIX domain-containing protein [Actinomycetota bacterium]MDG2119947.1 NUDIX domain-containing protein [Actinomycetota bacterium]
MHGPELCAGSIVYSEEKILLIRRGAEPEKGLWSLPGGRVQMGESIRHAALRELKEESNLEGQFEEMMGWVDLLIGEHRYVIVNLRFSVSNASNLKAGDDAAEAKFFKLEELHGLDMNDRTRNFLFSLQSPMSY